MIACKTNTIPILMHLMCISTNLSLFSETVMLRPECWKSEKNVKTVKEPRKTKTESHKIHSCPDPFMNSISSTSRCQQCWHDVELTSSTSLLSLLCQHCWHSWHRDVGNVNTMLSLHHLHRYCYFYVNIVEITMLTMLRRCWVNIVYIDLNDVTPPPPQKKKSPIFTI
jgi:hypothetical protein